MGNEEDEGIPGVNSLFCESWEMKKMQIANLKFVEEEK